MSNVVRRDATPVQQGREEGPVRAPCEVLASRRLGTYHQLTVVAPGVATRASPGQFVSLGVDAPGALLRRPFSIGGVSQRGPWAGTVDITFSPVGVGTRWLASREKHDVIDVIGPLGRAFPIPKQSANCLLVGGGYGAAPLLYLARELQAEGLRVDLIFGAASQDRLFNAIEAKRLATSTVFTTEDGSMGRQGRVTDVLPERLEATGAGVIYGCGPMGMLAGVARIAERHKVPCQVAVEESMACGVGVCMTCVVPYHRREGLTNVRACYEGPVLDAKRIEWDAIGTPEMGDARVESARP